MPFLNDLVLQPASKLWKLNMQLTYLDKVHGCITVRPGAITDGASIPWFLWSLVGSPLRDPRVARAAAIHDQLYKALGLGRLSRRECDEVFFRALQDEKVFYPRALVYFIGVRSGGWMGWKNYSRDFEEVAFQDTFITIEKSNV